MEYNTEKEKLVIKEYGRNIQSLINYAKTVENREKRTEIAEYIVEMMSQMYPHMKNIDEFRRKLWDHLFLISGFDLDVDSPFPIPTSAEEVIPMKEDKIPYPKTRIKYRHYGKNVETMVKKAREMEDEEKKKEFTEVIGNYMKLVYNVWNRDNINDEIIRNDLETLSEGELTLSNESNLDNLRQSNRKKRTKPSGSSSRSSGSGYKKPSGKRRSPKN